jgi:AcrR family transcriptional regulator
MNARRAKTDRMILTAARELLADGGVHDLTVEGVAERAGVAKTTVYRRYRSKVEIALAVLIAMVRDMAAIPESGDAHAELVVFLTRAADILHSTLMGRVMQGLVSDLATDPELAQAFREHVISLRIAELRRIVERGIARGQLRPETDAVLLNDLLFGPVYYRLFLSGGSLDSAFAERVVSIVLPAFAARGEARTAA